MVSLPSILGGSGNKGEEFDVEAVLATLTLAEKISLLGGKDFWHTVDIPEKGVPSVRVSDGPNGVRGIQFFNGTPSNCFPCATGLGSSFDLDLINEIGSQMGDECKAKGAHVILGPTINIQRSPLGGRGFESYSEDPLLSGKMASGYVKGVQAKGVSACLKHFVGNEQEFERFSNDSIIPDRALREIYLEPFRIATKEADPWCYMSSYNRVNGTHVSESKDLLDTILRKEWGWDGMIMSDWTGVYSSEQSVKAGLDLEMPGPPTYRGAQTTRDVYSGKLQEHHIDDRARAVLKLVKHAMASGIPFGAKESLIDNDQTRALLRKAAANSIVLLKNDKDVLPIKKASKIAVIGSNARVTVASGGGSASMLSSYTVTPLEGITAAAKEIGAEVEYSIGSASYLYLPAATKLLSHPSGNKGEKGTDVAQIDFWLQEPCSDFKSPDKAGVKISAKPDYATGTNTGNAFMMDGIPQNIGQNEPYLRYTADFTPDQSGDWTFALGSAGSSNLFVNGKPVIDNSTKWEPGEMWFNMGSKERTGVVQGLEAGKKYPVEIRCWFRKDLRGSPFKTAGAIRLGALPVIDDAQAIADAVKVAQQADTTIVVVGLNEDFESEGYDRKHMDLPGTANKLVSAVLAVAPNAIIVNQSGTPVTMPWVKEAATIVQAFYGGNDVGGGLADVLFGKLNPSSKLALTFPKRLADSPSDIGFGITSASYGKTFYQENIFVGYRHFEKSQTEALWPFGHGLSYTTFNMSDLSVSSISTEGEFEVSVKVKNTGKIDGKEVVQVYIRDVESSLGRPVKELKGFSKVDLKAGEEQTVTVKLDRDALKFWDDSRNYWKAEAGEFEVLVGNSSANVPLKATTKLEKTLTWLGL